MTVDIAACLDRYVRSLKEMGAIHSPAVERAFRRVERHRLVETFYHWTAESQEGAPMHHDPERPLSEHLELIYSNTALGTRFVDGMPASSSSQPSLVAEMLELLDLAAGMKVLEIGTGTGYNAALMAEMVGDQRLVVTVDVLEDVVEQTKRLLGETGYPGIQVILRDGIEGVPEEAPFDRVVATVGCSDISPRWAEQLARDGVLLVPLEHAGGHPLVLVRKEGGLLRGRVAGWSGFMPARGPIHIEGLWAIGTVRPGPGGPVDERDPWPGFGAEGMVNSLGCTADEVDFLFFVGLHDRRACWAPQGVGLSDGQSGWAVTGPDGIRWWKDASLVEELDRFHEEWLAWGRPTIRDYRISFVPIGDNSRPPAEGWQIERRFFRELVVLEPPTDQAS
jgi:protein-L-isoaspartate(D-aspartate) O-methyltransferase